MLFLTRIVILVMVVDRFSSVTVLWLCFFPRAYFIIDFVLDWLKTDTFISLVWTIKSALLTCSIKLWCDIALKRAGTCCVVDGDSSKTTEQILATCIVFVVSPDLPLSFGWGSPFLLKWNTLIFDGIDCWVDAFYLNLCWHVSGTAVVRP